MLHNYSDPKINPDKPSISVGSPACRTEDPFPEWSHRSKERSSKRRAAGSVGVVANLNDASQSFKAVKVVKLMAAYAKSMTH